MWPRRARRRSWRTWAAPLGKRSIGPGVAIKLADNDIGDGVAHAQGHAGEFRHGAIVVVAELHVGRAARVIHGSEGLQRHQHHRAIHLADDGAEGRAGAIGDHVHKEHVRIGCLDFGQRLVGALRAIDHAEVTDGDLVGFEFLHQPGTFAQQLIKQSRELLPVGVQANRKHGHIGAKGLAAGYDGIDHDICLQMDA